MGMGVKKDMEVEVTVEGGDEEAAAGGMEAFLRKRIYNFVFIISFSRGTGEREGNRSG